MGNADLTGKQAKFVSEYIAAFFNGTEAARNAGYGGDDNALAAAASRLLRNVKVKDALKACVEESAMSANEVLARLSRIASGDVADFTDEDGRFDFDKARKAKKTGLLKKLKRKTAAKKVDAFTEGDEEKETIETSIIHEEVEFEMYSAHEALRDLGKFHKLFTDKVEHSNPDGTPLFQPVSDALLKIYGKG